MEAVQTRRARLVSHLMDQMVVDAMDGDEEFAESNARLALLFSSAPDAALNVPEVKRLDDDQFELVGSGVLVHRVALEGFLKQRYGLSDDDIGQVISATMSNNTEHE